MRLFQWMYGEPNINSIIYIGIEIGNTFDAGVSYVYGDYSSVMTSGAIILLYMLIRIKAL